MDATSRAILQMGDAALEALCELTPTLDTRSRGSVFRFFLRCEQSFKGELRERIASRLLDGLLDKNAQTVAAAAQALAILGHAGQLTRLQELAAAPGAASEHAKKAASKISERSGAANKDA